MSNYLTDGYYSESRSAAAAPENVRAGFLRRTYAILLLAIVALVGLEALLISSGAGIMFIQAIGGSPALLIGTLVLFIASGFIAQYMARSSMSPAVQYLGLALFVCFEAVILLPMLTFCTMIPRFQHIPLQAGILTLVVFGGLSAVVFVSKKDFSFLGKILMICSLLAVGVVVLSFFTPINLGVWFSVAMIGLACGSILYDTSNVLHHYPPNAHVAAALELFSSMAMLFFYIIRLMLQLNSSD